jgi:hypothetical protein
MSETTQAAIRQRVLISQACCLNWCVVRVKWTAAGAALALAGWCTGVAVAHADPAPAPPPAPSTTIDADGTYTVGKDIQPGTYSSAGPVGDGACYWKRVNGSNIVDNALSKKSQIVQIEPTDTAFTTKECQPWQLTDAPVPTQGPGDLLGQLGQLGQIIARSPGPPPPGN